ncbi:hypothetical protein FQN60_010611 [Etheostoma spectabile]|uniref:Uncharacterized protein n=1 Tax=Etheostoma spectabile TaxID=54343 RepID=A0A5J5CA41_9PERO|nr:hypothetical protein FQN60_010611 [Etheostoma spectabile]
MQEDSPNTTSSHNVTASSAVGDEKDRSVLCKFHKGSAEGPPACASGALCGTFLHPFSDKQFLLHQLYQDSVQAAAH